MVSIRKSGNVSNLIVNDDDGTVSEEIKNQKPIKVLSTAKKTLPDIDLENFDTCTPGGLLDSAMKPVRLVTGHSDDSVTTTK